MSTNCIVEEQPMPHPEHSGVSSMHSLLPLFSAQMGQSMIDNLKAAGVIQKQCTESLRQQKEQLQSTIATLENQASESLVCAIS